MPGKEATCQLAILKFAVIRQERESCDVLLLDSLTPGFSTNGVNTEDFLRTATDEQEAL